MGSSWKSKLILRFNINMEESFIASQALQDSKSMQSISRVKKLQDIARMNIAILRINSDGEDDMEEARNIIRTMKNSLDLDEHYLFFS
jgi:hypothetical protein